MALLVRRAGGRDEEEPVEGAAFDYTPGNDQVAGVYRVERSPEYAEPIGFHGVFPLSDSAGGDPSVDDPTVVDPSVVDPSVDA